MVRPLQQSEDFLFLQDSGDMGDIIKTYNWPASSLGAMDRWPQSLHNTLGNILHSAFPMFLFWGDDLICFYNDAYRPSLGINGKHPAIGKPAKEVWQETWAFIGPLIENVITTGKPAFFEDYLLPINRNGKIEDVYWTFSYSPAYGDDSTICGVLVTCIETTQNVTDRKKVEELVFKRTEELEAAHASLTVANVHLQNIINLFKEPLQVLEPVFENGKIIDFIYKLTNNNYAAYAKTTPGELYNKRVGDVFPGYLHTTSFTRNADAFLTGIPDTWDIHYNMDGLDLYNRMSATKMGNELVVHFTDFSNMKHLQLQLEHKIKELERSNKNLEEFGHAASHDLKEPIRKIQVFLSMLKKQLAGHLQQRELNLFTKIENAGNQMALLVDDLLQYSHVSEAPPEKEDIDLKIILQNVLEALELDIQQTNAVINIGALPHINGFKRQLQQMFQNLVSNALKFTHKGQSPVINISGKEVTENEQLYQLIEVKDEGIGFEQKDAETIFKMFARLHSKVEYQGTGIGLAIVKKVVDNHGGIIKTESVPGKGTSFTLYFPAHKLQ